MIEDKFTNASVSRLLKEVAAAYEVTDQDKFRIGAYQNASASIEHLTVEIKDLWESDKLGEVPGVGASLKQHLDEYFKTGKVKHFDEVLSKLPQGMFGLVGLQGIGAKTAYKLADELKIKTREGAVEAVRKAASEGKLRELEGFGIQKEKDILEAVEKLKPGKELRKRMLLPTAMTIADRIIKFMSDEEAVLDIQPLGSLRRKVATIGDIDFAVATTKPDLVIKKFIQFPEIEDILGEGDVKSSVLLKTGVRIDLMTERPEAFGSLFQHFTGSKAHNIELRKLALEKGMSLSEHGIKEKGKLLEFSDEKSFYAHLGLKYIEPEMREDEGEIKLAEEGKLPKLIDLEDIKGDLHTHTTFSDGNNTLEEMVKAAKEKGYSYFGVSDHAPSVVSRGAKEVDSIINKTKSAIEQINKSNPEIRVLYGYEVNILADATVSLPDDMLKKLDYAIGSIHTSFDQPKEQITKRLINAIRNPYITFIAHPTGRQINSRDSYECDWEAVFKEVLEKNKILEINSQPERLDLPDILVREAVKKGVKLIINTDAHSVEDLNLMRYGIDTAKRGWVEKKNVVNTLALEEFTKIFLRRK